MTLTSPQYGHVTMPSVSAVPSPRGKSRSRSASSSRSLLLFLPLLSRSSHAKRILPIYSAATRVVLQFVHVRSLCRPHADGAVARLPHHFRRDWDRDAAVDGARGVAVATHRRRRVSAAREAMGKGKRDLVRCRRRVGDGVVVRARAALAALHAIRRTDHWLAVLARGIRVLH